MTRTSPNPLLLLFGMLFLGLIGLVGVMLLGSMVAPTLVAHQASEVTIDWLRPGQVIVPQGLTISTHSAKHHGDTEKIYQMLLEGTCVEVAMFCGGSDAERMYACVDPVTGLVGIMLRFGDEITTGYFSRNSNNLGNRINREKWEVCTWPD